MTSPRPHSSGPAPRADIHSLLESLPDAVFLFDCQGRLRDLNTPAQELALSSRKELLGADAAILLRRLIPPNGNASHHEELVTKPLKGEPVRRLKMAFRRNDEEVVEALVSGSPLCNSSGSVIGALVAVQDITELSGLQQQVASSERHFAVGQMTAGLAHDFNNVLNTISQAVNVLQMEAGRSQRERAMLGIIASSVRRGAEIVARLRDYLRGGRDEQFQVDLGQIMAEMLQLLQPTLEARVDIRVLRELQQQCSVRIHPAELRRVFTNLMLNAVDAMPHGGTLTLRCCRQHNRVVATVADTGGGIPPDAQKMIFSPYFTTKTKGTGLGLVGARRAIEAEGGQIRFKSSPEGTAFYIIFPLPPAEQQTHAA